MNIRNSIVAAVIAAAVASPALAVNLLTNGDFELNLGDVSNGEYTTVNAGASTITGWTVGGTSVDLIRNAYGYINSVSVDLAGTPGPGFVSQSFTQTLGETYVLTWDYSRNGPGAELLVEFGGFTTSFAVATGIVSQSLTYTATSTGSALVKFATATSDNSGPTIDNIVVTAVPEPEAFQLAIAALAIVGGFASRKSGSKA